MSDCEIVRLARGWLGTPYAHQASLKGVGCDCLGLIRGVWREAYGFEPETPPPYAPDWAEARTEEVLLTAARRHLIGIERDAIGPGAVLLFRWRPHLPVKHAAIAVSSDRMVHAQDGAAVSEVALTPWWHRRLSHAFRFPECER